MTTQTFLTTPVPATDLQRVWAGVLHGGPQAMLTGQAALVAQGWTLENRGPIHVIVPARIQRERLPKWLRLHRFVRPPCNAVGEPSRVNAHVATVHAAAWARTDREAVLLVISALQQRLTQADRLHTVVDDLGSIHRRRLILESVDEYADGIQSMNELDFAVICRKHHLPRPIRQARRLDGRRRCRYIDVEFAAVDGSSVVVEVEGLAHLDPDVWMDDTYRFNGLVVTGSRTILRANTFMIRYELERFLPDLKAALGLAGEAMGQTGK
ncbi:MAG: hypothetical protein MUF33_00935 [Candidatus Nanopelagicales bacterium]|jgi:hypothetical protein|nr:hypothetical protein [Candidatus Nanopelagicales bacterium]MCU0295957.1 hypothetical protein [Candidatus Nanopelagicales bacterium]MCU0297063.1 hypothetical protein [Candidatus Nanopelagicales bacterium]